MPLRPPTALPRFTLVMLLVVLCGVVIRFAWLDQKVYWFDEGVTSIHVRGYTSAEMAAELIQRGPIAPADFASYESLRPERGVFDVIRVLAQRDPHLGVVYYILLRLWVDVFGTSVAAIRAFSALWGVLTLPLMYGLCHELYGDARFGWISAALLAVSPFFVLYSQEARPYALWAWFTVASTFALLRAMRLNRWHNWLLYGLTVGLGMATQLLMAAVLLAHGLVYALEMGWLTALRQRQPPRPALPYLAATTFGLALYAPWGLNTLSQQDRVGDLLDWTAAPTPWSHLIPQAARGFVTVFIDPMSLNRLFVPPVGRWPVPMILGAVLLWLAIAFIGLWRTGPRRASLLVTALFVLPALTLVLPDLIGGGQRSAVFRYWVPAYVALILAMTYLIGSPLMPVRLRAALFAFLLVGGVTSWALSVPGPYWWHKGYGDKLPVIAAELNAAPHPLVIMTPRQRNLANVIGLRPFLASHVRLQFVDETDRDWSILGEYELYTHNPTETLISSLMTQGYRMPAAPPLDSLVRITR